MRDVITIGDRKVGKDHPLFIVAECGVTCNYDMEITKGLIDAVAESGADAIKFIFWFPDEIFSDRSMMFAYKTPNGTEERNMYEMMMELRFTLDEWREVKTYADSKGVIVFSTVNSPGGIEWAEEIGLDAYKLSSWDFNHHPLWRQIAQKGKPMIIDTGPVYMHELAKVLAIMKDEGNDQTILVHCHHNEKPEETNMRSIPYLERAFNAVVGYSATDGADEPDLMAIALGASFLEKRLTLDRNLPGHHHVLSLEPKEFKAYVDKMRTSQSMLGQYDLIPSPNDLKDRARWFRHLVANRDLAAGTVIMEDMLEGKRGEYDVSPEFQDFFIGRTLKRDLKENESILWEDV